MALKRAAVFGLMCALASNAYAGQTKSNKYLDYVGLSAGYAISKQISNFGQPNNAVHERLSNAFVYGLSIGKNINSYARAEVELTHKHKYDFLSETEDEIEKAKFSNTSAFVNGYLEHKVFKRSDALKVYGMLGAGVSRNDFMDYVLSLSWNRNTASNKHVYKFAWQAGVGISNTLNDISVLDVSVKYVDRGEVQSPAQYKKKNGKMGTFFKTKKPMEDVVLTGTIRIQL